MDVDRLIDREVAEGLKVFPEFPPLSDELLPVMREGMKAMPQPPLSDAVERTDHVVPDREVPVRVHRPRGAEMSGLPCLVWMHGGGLVLGSHEMDDARFDRWCQQYGLVGVSIGYRLAPESPYPGPIEDCYAALRWVHEQADSLGIDRSRIGIGGASAGGGLAAGLALLARDRGEVPVQYQLLIYPMIDDRQVTASSGWEVPIWPPASNTFGWTAYLGDKRGGADVEPYAAAARATDLAGLPPALISVGSLDGFLHEDLDYAARLAEAGVPVELHVYPGGVHAFDAMPGVKIAERAVRDMEEWLEARVAKA